eukprot:7550435-Alexandrium_andersonii.AAC.1
MPATICNPRIRDPATCNRPNHYTCVCVKPAKTSCTDLLEMRTTTAALKLLGPGPPCRRHATPPPSPSRQRNPLWRPSALPARTRAERKHTHARAWRE